MEVNPYEAPRAADPEHVWTVAWRDGCPKCGKKLPFVRLAPGPFYCRACGTRLRTHITFRAHLVRMGTLVVTIWGVAMLVAFGIIALVKQLTVRDIEFMWKVGPFAVLACVAGLVATKLAYGRLTRVSIHDRPWAQ